jgi:hypothetical protein
VSGVSRDVGERSSRAEGPNVVWSGGDWWWNEGTGGEGEGLSGRGAEGGWRRAGLGGPTDCRTGVRATDDTSSPGPHSL